MSVHHSKFWAEIEDTICPCTGSGWAEVSEQWQECPIHYLGQLHPESRLLLLDEPIKLREEERLSRLRWKINNAKESIVALTSQLKDEYSTLRQLELELTNRTPTTKIEISNILKSF